MSDKQVRSIIAGCGSYLPKNVVTNDDLAKVVETSHDWIVERTGIHQRHFVEKGQELCSDLATQAAKNALEMAGVKAEDVDLIVLGTTTPDLTFPSTATIVQNKLGNTKGFAFDVSAVCSGFLTGLNVADSYIRSGQVKTAVVIGAETASHLLDMSDRRTCVLFGDGAGAVVLQATSDTSHDRGILGIHMKSDGRFKDVLYVDGGVGTTGNVGKIQMQGQEMFRHAVTKLASSAQETLERHKISPDQLDWLVPHQANIRIIQGLAKKFNIPYEKVIVTVDKHANTSAASIPLALDDAVRSGKIKQGDLILFEAIGGGLVWGSGLARF